MSQYILWLHELGMDDLARVGGKNASLGEMYCQLSSKGVDVPNGFATTAEAWWTFVDFNQLRQPFQELFEELDYQSFSNLNSVGERARKLIMESRLPDELCQAIRSEEVREL